MVQRLVLPDTTAARVLIAGDIMLDRYWFGDVRRISPEAPVPVAKINRVENRLGGGANVARNVQTLGAQAVLLSVVGTDEAGQALSKLVAESAIQALLHEDSQLPTTVKLRVISRHQQLIRLDFEQAPDYEILNTCLHDFERSLEACKAVILSDYGKGGLTHIERMISSARAANKPVLIDPKGNNYDRYRGATLITPNSDELRQVTGDWDSEQALARKAASLLHKLELKAILLTRAEEGMSLFEADGTVTHVEAVAREVFDVSGAGDTVIATCATMLACGLALADAMRFANLAAGVVVGKLGVATCSRAELSQEFKQAVDQGTG